ncbi:MAG: hypothetical protein FWD48_00795 [Oscillospiraceae bacterium]|nr:hypothetical protein [Oscillospiraceae bacterium]
MDRTVFIILIILALLMSACAVDEPLKSPPPSNSPPVTTTQPAEEIIPTFSADNPRELDYTEVNFRIRTSFITTDTSWLDFELNNRSGTEFLYGEVFTLYKDINGSWEYVDMMYGADFNDTGLILMPDSINNGSIDIGYFFGFLGEGNYRIEKDIFSLDEWCIVTAEFEVFEAEK